MFLIFEKFEVHSEIPELEPLKWKFWEFSLRRKTIILERDLITIDLESVNGYPQIEIPHPIDFHDTPITSVKYIQDAKSLFISGLLKM